jgi:TolB-like protein/Tfp pilus assembly protein PilF
VSTPSQAVFLSYASQDADAARRIRDALYTIGVDVWFDESELRGGDAWDASIRKQIKDCALFVPVISTNTNARSEGYFRLEWKLAVDRSHLIADDQAFLLPVVIDSTRDANARVPVKFREVQWTHLPAGETAVAFAEHVHRLLLGAPAPSSIASALVAPRSVPTRTSESPSIAVLPFVNRSQDEEDEYFADGLADELLNVLAKIRGLRVAARSSAFTFKGTKATVAEMGRALNVATVLEGSVRKSGNRLRISVQLVKVADGYHMWSERYDRTLEDIFAVQDDIAQSVVKELRATLLGEAVDAKAATEVTAQVAAATRGRTTDSEAHRLYLQARHFLDRFTPEETTKAVAYLKQALELDPAFALAWAELSHAYTTQADQCWAPVAEGYARAREAVMRALALEPNLAEGYTQLAWIQMVHDWDWRKAEASYGRALELAPGDARVLRRVGVWAANLGHLEQAVELYRRAIGQDPLSATAYQNLGLALDAAGRFVEAEAAYRKALELSPQRAAAHALLAMNLLARRRSDEAFAEALQEPEEWVRLWALAILHHVAGRGAEADAALHELIAKYAAVSLYQVGMVYAVRGESELAFEWLERAYAKRDAGLSEMKCEALFRVLHDDPRWDAFLRKMGFAE